MRIVGVKIKFGYEGHKDRNGQYKVSALKGQSQMRTGRVKRVKIKGGP